MLPDVNVPQGYIHLQMDTVGGHDCGSLHKILEKGPAPKAREDSYELYGLSAAGLNSGGVLEINISLFKFNPLQYIKPSQVMKVLPLRDR